MYYPPVIKEGAPFSSEVRDALERVEAAGLGAALAVTSSEEPAKESKLFGVAETDEGQNSVAPQEIVGSIGDAPISYAGGPVLLVEPLQAVPLSEGPKDIETPPVQPSEVGDEIRSKE